MFAIGDHALRVGDIVPILGGGRGVPAGSTAQQAAGHQSRSGADSGAPTGVA
jgi:hypothetical protein